jgi:hypothetical protein
LRFQALAKGVDAAIPGSGRVHSVFRRVCNLSSAAGGLYTLFARRSPMLPNGILLDVPETYDFRDAFRPGQSTSQRAGVLRIGEANVSIDLRFARPWSGDLSAPQLAPMELREDGGLDPGWSKICGWRHGLWCSTALAPWTGDLSSMQLSPMRFGEASRLDAAWSQLVGWKDGLWCSTALARLLQNDPPRLADQLVRATRALEAARAATHLQALAGVGAGLTPAGDDFIVGYLGGIWCNVGTADARRRFIAELQTPLQRTVGDMGDISRACAEPALRGHFAEPLVLIAQRLREGASADSVSRAVQNLLAVGSTSGADALVGFLLACAAWSETPQGERLSSCLAAMQ